MTRQQSDRQCCCRVQAFVGSETKPSIKVKEDAKVLFQPVQLGSLKLQHRIVMAPLTRCR